MIKKYFKIISEKIKNMSMRTKRITALFICLVLLTVAIAMNSQVENGEAGKLKGDIENVDVGLKDEALNQSGNLDGDVGKGVVKVEDADEYFATLRLNKLNERSQQQESFNEIIESDSAEESYIAEAVTKIEELEEINALEDLTETMVSARGYSDVFVKIDNEFVYITVLADSLNENEASAIATTVSKETGILIEDIILKGVY